MFDSFANFFTTVQIVIITGAAAFIAGVFLSQKVKDWLAGVPTDLRSALKAVEGDALGRVKAAQAAVLADIAGLVHGGTVAPKIALSPAAVDKVPLAPPTGPLVAPAAPAPVVKVEPASAAVAPAPVVAGPLPTQAPVLPSEGPPLTPVA